MMIHQKGDPLFDDFPATAPRLQHVGTRRVADDLLVEATLGADYALTVAICAPAHTAHPRLANVLAERFAPEVDYAALLDAARRVVQAFDVTNSPANRAVRCRDLWGAATALTALAQAVGQ